MKIPAIAREVLFSGLLSIGVLGCYNNEIITPNHDTRVWFSGENICGEYKDIIQIEDSDGIDTLEIRGRYTKNEGYVDIKRNENGQGARNVSLIAASDIPGEYRLEFKIKDMKGNTTKKVLEFVVDECKKIVAP